VARSDASVSCIGYAGSYASANWGVGSNVDLVVIVPSTEEPCTQRSHYWNTLGLPVPADVPVYRDQEWDLMRERGRHITRDPITWVYARDSEPSTSASG
jgi:hypothetical protein